MKRTRTYILLWIASLLSSTLLSINAQAARNSVISFTDRNDDITLINTQGEILNRIETGLTSMSSFTWAPNGRSFAYASYTGRNSDIYVMDLRTKESRQLTHNPSRDSSPAWAPDGKWIAFVSARNEGRQIYRMDVNGENVMQLTKKGNNNRPAWSPDSQWIAFDSYLGNHEDRLPGKYAISVMTADGRKLRNVIEKEVTLGPGCTWSPDGEQIAFAVGNPLGLELFVIDVNGRNLRKLTHLNIPAFSIVPAWSPDGKWIAYVFAELPARLPAGQRVPADEIFRDSAIYIINAAEGGQGEPLEATRGMRPGNPVWVPETFFPVSPSTETQTTLWGELKQVPK